MSAVEDRLLKLREERHAREKARIEKLRELNQKKYNKNENNTTNVPQKLVKSNNISQIMTNTVKNIENNKRPTTALIRNNSLKLDRNKEKAEIMTNTVKNIENNKRPTTALIRNNSLKLDRNKEKAEPKINFIKKNVFAVKTESKDLKVKELKEKTIINKNSIHVAKTSKMKLDSKESVFDRLHKPKVSAETALQVEKIQNDPNYVKKVIENSGLIDNRDSCFKPEKGKKPVRRSFSAMHFERIKKDKANNCIKIHKNWASTGKLNRNLTLDEIKDKRFGSAIKSEWMNVTFIKPMSKLKRPIEDKMQKRLTFWLQKQGKSLDSYKHLECFRIHHLKPKLLELSTPKHRLFDEENKENIAVDSDSDDGSYTDNNLHKDTIGDDIDVDKWRQDASKSMYTEFTRTNDFNNAPMTSADTFPNIDDLLIGTLNDLTELIREGFDFEQSVRYLHAIRFRFKHVVDTPAYWVCRAALEESRGDLHTSVQCWEEAIAKGTDINVVEANLDTLLDKFMQLEKNPHAASNERPDPKIVAVKNVFKRNIIRFAVLQAKLRKSKIPVITWTPTH